MSKLFVGNLSYDVDKMDLEEAFQKYRVADTIIISDRETGRPRGFGFVTMDTPEEAEKAIEEMSGFELKGRAMTVNQATERPARDNRGGRDFRSGGGYQRRDNNRGYQQRDGGYRSRGGDRDGGYGGNRDGGYGGRDRYQGNRDGGYQGGRGGDRYGDDFRGQRQERGTQYI